jgi:tripartite-type tricarboxylate transporter receptor subunit TctC
VDWARTSAISRAFVADRIDWESHMVNHRIGLAVACALAVAQPAAAQTDYPSKPIRMIVTFTPGGPTDVIGRLIAQRISESWGQKIVVENIAGGGGNIGVAAVMRAPADGYTIAVVSTGFVINPGIYAKVPYQISDFAPICLVAGSPDVLTVHPSVQASTVRELIDLVRAQPGKLSYAHPGTGSTAHLAAEYLKLRYNLDLATVPFGAAGGRAITAVLGGHTPVAFTALPSAAPSIKDGKLRGLAVLAAKRNSNLPDVPTMAEAGVPELESDTLTGIVALAGTPKEIIDRWHREIARIVAMPQTRERLNALGFEPMASTPQDYADRIKREAAKWDRIAREANIRIN